MGELDIYILGLALQHIESSYFDGAAGRKPPPILFTLLEGPNPSSFCTFCWKKKEQRANIIPGPAELLYEGRQGLVTRLCLRGVSLVTFSRFLGFPLNLRNWLNVTEPSPLGLGTRLGMGSREKPPRGRTSLMDMVQRI